MILDIDLSGVPYYEAAQIRGAIGWSNGRYIDMREIRVTDAGVEALAKALPGSNLTILDIRSNALITDAGAIALAEALPRCKLTSLFIWGRITDVGAKALAEALSTSTLARLDIRNNHGITDVGGRALLAAIPRSNLAGIMFLQTQISQPIQDAIQVAATVRRLRNKLFLLLRLRFVLRFDGDNAMLHRVADFLWRTDGDNAALNVVADFFVW